MRGGDRRGSPVVSRRVLLAAGGAVLLASTAAAADAEARAHGLGAQPRPAPNVPAGRVGGTSGPRASISSGPGEARAVTSPPVRKHPAPARRHPVSARSATRPPRPQPRLPYGEPMSTVEDGKKVVALTIDDGPSPVYTSQILRVLGRYGVTASFSMVGRNAAAFSGLAREVAAAGHMIVNHTWNHYNLGYMPAVAGRPDGTARVQAALLIPPDFRRRRFGVRS